jgi:hypothetical protein
VQFDLVLLRHSRFCLECHEVWACYDETAPARPTALTRSLEKNRYAAFVLAQSWQAGHGLADGVPHLFKQFSNLSPNLSS